MLFCNINELISKNHKYRKILNLINFNKILYLLPNLKQNSEKSNGSYSKEQYIKMLFLQFLEDLSDREMEKFLQENIAGKYFCNFDLNEKTPSYTIFTYIRRKIGTEKLAKIFNEIKNQFRGKGFIAENFTFIDASHLISKANIWEDRDRLIDEKEGEFNNQNLKKEKPNKTSLKCDLQARNGCKGKNKYWFGYKRNVSVDMESGMINKVAMTPANVPDGKAVKHVLPSTGDVYADKGYSIKTSLDYIKARGLGDCVIKKNNSKEKDFERDRIICKKRCPFERVFSQMRKKTRYRGIAKNQFMLFMEAISFNIKRALVLSV